MDVIESNFLDGINFDYESVIEKDDEKTRRDYKSIVVETNAALKKKNPHSQVFVDQFILLCAESYWSFFFSHFFQPF